MLTVSALPDLFATQIPDNTNRMVTPQRLRNALVSMADAIPAHTKFFDQWAAGDGITDDTADFQAMFDTAVNGDHFKATPGKIYVVSAAITCTGVDLTFDFRGATIRIADDSVWNVFNFGGDAQDSFANRVTILGGIFDGNFANQRYWPNIGGGIAFTDAGEEVAGSETGAHWYANSSVNGTTWDNDWLNGTAGDGIDLNGGGNDGLIRIQHTKRAEFLGGDLKDYIRNGYVAWNCDDIVFDRVISDGQLSTNFNEQVAQFGRAYECAAMKAAWPNDDSLALSARPQRHVNLSRCRVNGGCMPLFVRTNEPKAESPGIHVVLDDFIAHGFSRDIWFEHATIIRMTNCFFAGIYDPTESSRRGNSGVYIANSCENWSFVNSVMANGIIDTRQKQQMQLGVVSGSQIHRTSRNNDTTPVVSCTHLSDSIVTSTRLGAETDYATNVEAHAEETFSLKVAKGASNCKIGRVRRSVAPSHFQLSKDEITVDLGNASAVIERIFRLNRNAQSGTPYLIHDSDYSNMSGVITFERGAAEGDIIVVEWYAPITQGFTNVGAEVSYTLDEPGGRRLADIVSVTHDPQASGSPVTIAPYTRALTETASPHFTYEIDASNRCVVTLFNVTTAATDEVNVTILPPMVRYAGAVVKSGGDGQGGFDLHAVNVNRIAASGSGKLSGSIMDSDYGINASGADSDLSIEGFRAERIAKSCIDGQVSRLTIRHCEFIDWGLDGASLFDEECRCIGGTYGAGIVVSDMLAIKGNTFYRTLAEGAASNQIGRSNNHSLLRPQLLISGENAFINTNANSGFAAKTELLFDKPELSEATT